MKLTTKAVSKIFKFHCV